MPAVLDKFLHQRSGLLTSELLLRPNDFGLGKLPRNLETDSTTTSICGFCSTGCQLKLHLHEGEAIGVTPSPLPEPECSYYPFTLLTGRGTSAQWHTQSRTAKSAVLKKLHPDALFPDIHPDDAAQLGLKDRDEVVISSRRASITARAQLTTSVK